MIIAMIAIVFAMMFFRRVYVNPTMIRVFRCSFGTS